MNISNKPLKKNIKKHRYQILCARRVSGITLISPWEQENQKKGLNRIAKTLNAGRVILPGIISPSVIDPVLAIQT